MTTSKKILISAAVILLMAFLQIGVAEQLVAESETGTFTLRSPILIAMSVVQVIFGISKKIEEDKPARKRAKTQ